MDYTHSICLACLPSCRRIRAVVTLPRLRVHIPNSAAFVSFFIRSGEPLERAGTFSNPILPHQNPLNAFRPLDPRFGHAHIPQLPGGEIHQYARTPHSTPSLLHVQLRPGDFILLFRYLNTASISFVLIGFHSHSTLRGQITLEVPTAGLNRPSTPFSRHSLLRNLIHIMRRV